jgi:hypothetical protein
MLLRRFTDFILQNRLQAMAVAFLLSFVPLFGASLGVLIAALVTLRKGTIEGVLVLSASIVPFLLGYAMSSSVSEGPFLLVATETVIAINVLTWLLAIVLRRYANWSIVVEVAALIGAVLICSVHFISPDIQSWWAARLTAYFNKTASLLAQFAPEGINTTPKNDSAEMIANIKRYMTGFVIASMIFNALLQLMLARWWQAVMFNPGALRKELQQIRLSYVMVASAMMVSILAYMGNAVGVDLLPILIVAFCAAGLSLIHCILILRAAGWFWLLLVYLGVLFVFPIGIVLVAVLGLFDSLLDLRKRLKK